MKRTVLISDTAQSVGGIQCVPLTVTVARLDPEKHELRHEPQTVFVKALTPDEAVDAERLCGEEWYVTDADLPNDTLETDVEQLACHMVQLKTFSTDLAALREKDEAVSAGWFPWTLHRALHSLSRTWSALTEINEVVTGIGTDSRWQHYVSDMLGLVASLKARNEGRRGIVEARKAKVDFAIVIITIVIGVIVALVLG